MVEMNTIPKKNWILNWKSTGIFTKPTKLFI
jgi:hypothetical protein